MQFFVGRGGKNVRQTIRLRDRADLFGLRYFSVTTHSSTGFSTADVEFMKLALGLARKGRGTTSPNPMVGAVLVKNGGVLGQGWHRKAGSAHAEVEAIRDAESRGVNLKGATLYVTLEPCSSQGRTPPCTGAIIRAGIKRVVVGATDPNPRHRGRAYAMLRRAGLKVEHGLLAKESERLNEAFNHWIVRRTPFVTVKAAMTLDGKIATPTGESKWITGPRAREWAMNLRRGVDAILVGVNTVISDNPSLTFRGPKSANKKLRRIVLDSSGRTPLDSKIITDESASLTTVVVTRKAGKRRIAALSARANVLVAPMQNGRVALNWLLTKLGGEEITSLLVEGGGEVNSSFLLRRLAQRVVFFYAPKILGGINAKKAVAGKGARSLNEILKLHEVEWRRLGPDLLLTALIDS